MTDEQTTDDVVYESALQLWAAAQTDFDPYQVAPSEWGPAVPIRDADISYDTGLEVEAVRDALQRLDGKRLVVGEDAGNLAVKAPISEGGAP